MKEMDSSLYFKCQKCQNIFNKKTKKIIQVKNVNFSPEYGLCDSCLEYQKWERHEYF